MARRFMSINLAKPMETVEQYPFVLAAWPSFADQPYITNYRIYDDRVGETQRFTFRPSHEWYWFPQQTPTEVSMLKCYDSLTDGSVRSEERRVGKECVSTCRYRWATYH